MTERFEYHVLPFLDATVRGPARVSDGELVHLRQGDADGACGPYCVLMTLLMLGLVDRQTVVGLERPHGNSKLGRLFKTMRAEEETLFREGTGLDELGKLLHAFRSDLSVEQFDERGARLRGRVGRALEAGQAVILMLEWQGGGAHWVVAVGTDRTVRDGEVTINRFLLLDPGTDPGHVAPWNAVVDVVGGKGPFPYTYWSDGEETQARYGAAISIGLRG